MGHARMKIAFASGFVRKDFFERILPLPSYEFVMAGWDEKREDCHTMGMQWWDEWTVRCQQSWPLRYWLHHTLPIHLSYLRRKYFKDPYWRVRHRVDPRHRYHTIRTGLKPGYWDPDSRILHGVMEMVEEFVEENHFNWDHERGHRRAWKVLTEAVAFWKEYNAFWEKDNERWSGDDKEAHRRAHEAEYEMERLADTHLAKVMKVRQYLWY